MNHKNKFPMTCHKELMLPEVLDMKVLVCFPYGKPVTQRCFYPTYTDFLDIPKSTKFI